LGVVVWAWKYSRIIRKESAPESTEKDKFANACLIRDAPLAKTPSWDGPTCDPERESSTTYGNEEDEEAALWCLLYAVRIYPRHEDTLGTFNVLLRRSSLTENPFLLPKFVPRRGRIRLRILHRFRSPPPSGSHLLPMRRLRRLPSLKLTHLPRLRTRQIYPHGGRNGLQPRRRRPIRSRKPPPPPSEFKRYPTMK